MGHADTAEFEQFALDQAFAAVRIGDKTEDGLEQVRSPGHGQKQIVVFIRIGEPDVEPGFQFVVQLGPVDFGKQTVYVGHFILLAWLVNGWLHEETLRGLHHAVSYVADG